MTEFLAIRKRAEAAKTFIKDEAGIKIEVKSEVEGKIAVEEDEDDDDDESDEDFDPDAVDEDASGIDSDDSRYSDGEGDEDANMSDDEGTRNIQSKKGSRGPSAKRKKNEKMVVSAGSETVSTVIELSTSIADNQNYEKEFFPDDMESPNKKKIKLEHGI